MIFCSFDSDLDPMILILKADLNIVMMYQYTQNDIPNFNGSNSLNRHTDKFD